MAIRLLSDPAAPGRAAHPNEPFTLAKPIGALHQAVSYLHIVKSVEPMAKPECASGVPDFLRVVLRALPEPVAPAV